MGGAFLCVGGGSRGGGLPNPGRLPATEGPIRQYGHNRFRLLPGTMAGKCPNRLERGIRDVIHVIGVLAFWLFLFLHRQGCRSVIWLGYHPAPGFDFLPHKFTTCFGTAVLRIGSCSIFVSISFHFVFHFLFSSGIPFGTGNGRMPVCSLCLFPISILPDLVHTRVNSCVSSFCPNIFISSWSWQCAFSETERPRVRASSGPCLMHLGILQCLLSLFTIRQASRGDHVSCLALFFIFLFFHQFEVIPRLCPPLDSFSAALPEPTGYSSGKQIFRTLGTSTSRASGFPSNFSLQHKTKTMNVWGFFWYQIGCASHLHEFFIFFPIDCGSLHFSSCRAPRSEEEHLVRAQYCNSAAALIKTTHPSRGDSIYEQPCTRQMSWRYLGNPELADALISRSNPQGPTPQSLFFFSPEAHSLDPSRSVPAPQLASSIVIKLHSSLCTKASLVSSQFTDISPFFCHLFNIITIKCAVL